MRFSDIGQAVGVIALDRHGPAVIRLLPLAQRDAFVLLNEAGTISLRVRRCLYEVADGSQGNTQNLSQRSGSMSKSVSTASIPSTPSLVESDNLDVLSGIRTSRK